MRQRCFLDTICHIRPRRSMEDQVRRIEIHELQLRLGTQNSFTRCSEGQTNFYTNTAYAFVDILLAQTIVPTDKHTHSH